MKSLLLLITTLLFTSLLFTHSTQADTYQYAVSVGHNDADSHGEEEQSNRVGGTYFVFPVDDSKGPLALASFIDRASGISIGYRDSETELILPPFEPMPPSAFSPVLPGGTPPGGELIMPENPEIDSEELSFTGFYVFKESGWIVSAGLGKLEGDGKFSTTNLDIDGDSYQLQIGKYIAATTTISVSYSETERTENSSTSLCDILAAGPFPFPGPCLFDDEITSESETELTRWGLAFNHLGQLSNIHYTINAELANISSDATLVLSGLGPVTRDSFSRDDDWQYSAGVAIYPNSALGLGVDYTLFDVAGNQTHIYEAFVSWFLNNSLSVGASFAQSDGENSVPDTDVYNFWLSARF